MDEKAPTFRHKVYPEYKATRDKMPEDLVAQLEPINELLDAAKISTLSLAGYEADDIMGTLATKFSDKFDIVILTSDKDLYQLVNNNIQIYRLSKKVYVGINDVKKKFGVSPPHITDLLALMGDSSDNVPGIPRVGKKTAAKLINEFGSIENIIKNKEKIKGKSIKENVKKYAEQGLLSKKLVTLDLDVPISVTPENLKLDNIFTDELFKYCEKYELESLLKYFSKNQIRADELKTEYILVNEKENFNKLLAELKNAKIYCS